MTVSGAYVAAALIGALACRYMVYCAGRANDLTAGMKWVLLILPLLGLSGLIMCTYDLAMFTWRPRTRRRIALGLVLLAIPLGTLVGVLFIAGSVSPVFLSGFSHWAAQNADIDAIQQWLTSEGPAFVQSHQGPHYPAVDPNDYPACLTAFAPATILFPRTAAGELTVEFGWAAGSKVWDSSWDHLRWKRPRRAGWS